jgi:hypothetical protein
MANKVEGVTFSAGFAGFEGGSIAPMKLDETLHFIFAAELKPSAPARFIHFGSPFPSKQWFLSPLEMSSIPLILIKLITINILFLEN